MFFPWNFVASVGDMLKILELDMAQLRQELNELRDISNTFQKLASDKEFQKHVQTKLMDAFDKDWEEQHGKYLVYRLFIMF